MNWKKNKKKKDVLTESWKREYQKRSHVTCCACGLKLDERDIGWGECFVCYKERHELKEKQSLEKQGIVITKHGHFTKKMEQNDGLH